MIAGSGVRTYALGPAGRAGCDDCKKLDNLMLLAMKL